MNNTEMIKQFTGAFIDIPKLISPMSIEDKRHIINMVSSECEELEFADNIVDQVDALLDILYYIYDRAIRHGIDLDSLLPLVHAANMRKIENGVILENGKVQKPEGWYGPEEAIKQTIRGTIMYDINKPLKDQLSVLFSAGELKVLQSWVDSVKLLHEAGILTDAAYKVCHDKIRKSMIELKIDSKEIVPVDDADNATTSDFPE